MRKRLLIFTIIPLLSVFLLLGTVIYLHVTHWSNKYIFDNTEIKLSVQVTNVAGAFSEIEREAKKWRKDAILTNILMYFDNAESISNRKGIITYSFYAKNKSFLGKPFAIYFIKVDMEKQAIVERTSLGIKNSSSKKQVNINNVNVDITNIFDILEKQEGKNFIANYPSPKVIISLKDNEADFFIEYQNNQNKSRDFFKVDIKNAKVSEVRKAK
ncbi:hypothetical protein [Acetivibrio cellulolyticus]|uniref:hypothetical protein n=1 Tax=Acetivibrio cellulolyticus TaxID=35830 RepID=UPI0001E30197|nr:hypothetical protein [Acetivibrio cellulolyticus]